MLYPQGQPTLCVVNAITCNVLDNTYNHTYNEIQEHMASFKHLYKEDAFSEKFMYARMKINFSSSMGDEQYKYENKMFSGLCAEVVLKWKDWENKCESRDKNEISEFEKFIKEVGSVEGQKTPADLVKMFSEWRGALTEEMQRTHLMGLFERAVKTVTTMSGDLSCSEEDILVQAKTNILMRIRASFPLCYINDDCTTARSREIKNIDAEQLVHGLTYANLNDLVWRLGYKKGQDKMTSEGIITMLRECSVMEEGRYNDHTMLSYALAYLLSAEFASMKFVDVGEMLYSLSFYMHSVARGVRLYKL